jgi:CRISPR/Cas system-associated protein Csx1
MSKIDDKIQRVKYMRLLEKFLKSSLTILKLENFNYDLFSTRALKIYDLIKKIDNIRIDSEYYKSLQNFAELTISTLRNENLKDEEKRNLLLKEVNLIDKNRNRKIRKKLKHKNSDKEEY